jgi:hypothetical protein
MKPRQQIPQKERVLNLAARRKLTSENSVKAQYAGFVKMHVAGVLSLILDSLYANKLSFPAM